MPFAEVNGQNIHYQDTGGDGPAIILSHGFGMGHEMWVHQIDPLVGAGWRVVTYDERSWGQTTHTEPFDYWDLAADVIALMDHLGIDRAVLGGMSQGGFLSMRAALATPERVRALVLVDTEAEVYSDEKVDRARAFLAQRQQEVKMIEERLDEAKVIANDIHNWAMRGEIEEDIARSEIQRLSELLSDVMPELDLPEGADLRQASRMANGRMIELAGRQAAE